MAINLLRPDKSTPKTTAIMRGQRASCVAQIFRYRNPDVAKIVNLNAANEKSLFNSNKPGANNLDLKPLMTIKNDIIRCNISHSKSSPSGTFSLVLKKGKQIKNDQLLEEHIDYVEAVNPGDWIALYLKKDGEITTSDLNSVKSSSGFKFLGIVENVRYVEVDAPDRGTPRLEYIITGRSFGKVLETSIFYNPQVNNETVQTVLGAKFITNSPTALAGNNPGVIISKILDFFLGGAGTQSSGANDTWYVPRDVALKFKSQKQLKSRGASFSDILSKSQIGLHKYSAGRLSTKALPGAVLVKSLPSSGTIWSIMQFLQNSVINEMYVDLIPDNNGLLKPSVVLRQLPFSNKPKHETSLTAAHNRYSATKLSDSSGFDKTYFVDLPRHEIVSSDIHQKNVGKSEHERINYAIVVPRIDSNTFDVGYVVASNIPSIQRYGLKKFDGQTAYVLANSTGSVGKDGITNYCNGCVSLISDWFFLSHNLYNGTIVIDGVNEHVPIGQNLYITDSKQLYHIEGYTHNYEISEDAKTTYTSEFRVSRGQLLDGSVASFIGASKNNNDPTTVAVSFLPNDRRKS